MKFAALAGLCLFMLQANGAHAAESSVSYSTWTVSGRIVALQFVLPASEAQRLVGKDLPTLTVRELGRYVLKHVAVRTRVADCPAIDQGYDLGVVDPREVGPGLYGFEIFFQCAAVDSLVLQDDVLFDRVPGHVDFARIQMQGRSVDRLFTAGQRKIRAPADELPAPSRFAEYMSLGGLHVLRGAIPLCFLLGTVLLARRRRDAGFVLAALALGYLLSLAVSAMGWLLPRINLVEAFMGLLVAILGLLMTLRAVARHTRTLIMGWSGMLLIVAVAAAVLGSSLAALFVVGAAAFSGGFLVLSHWYDRRQGFWILLAVLFGFLDGCILSSTLSPVHFPQPVAVRLLSSFGAGAVLVEALLLGTALGAVALLRRGRLAAGQALAADLSAACLAGVGAFCLVSRLWTA